VDIMLITEPRALEMLGRAAYGRLATSMRAMPFMASARHIVVNGHLVLRLHAGSGIERACCGSVVAYGADNLDSGAATLWSVQCTGTARTVRPSTEELERLGPPPRHIDGGDFRPVYMRMDPQFATAHTMGRPEERP
jgi:hypothetical protein